MKPRATQLRLQGKVALITGGSRGIGLAIAQALVAEGCDLVITGRHQASLKKAAKQLGRETVPLICDVRDPEAVANLCAAIKDRCRNLDILINNAGVAHADLHVDKLPLESWREVIDTNLTGMFLVTRAALPLMKRGAAIVNNLSIAAKRVFPGSSAYNASKHGALGFTNTVREEVRGRGISGDRTGARSHRYRNLANALAASFAQEDDVTSHRCASGSKCPHPTRKQLPGRVADPAQRWHTLKAQLTTGIRARSRNEPTPRDCEGGVFGESGRGRFRSF